MNLLEVQSCPNFIPKCEIKNCLMKCLNETLGLTKCLMKCLNVLTRDSCNINYLTMFLYDIPC